jgi:hypothetical protein
MNKQRSSSPPTSDKFEESAKDKPSLKTTPRPSKATAMEVDSDEPKKPTGKSDSPFKVNSTTHSSLPLR